MLGYNMFTYCNNNPVNSVDSSGYLPHESNIANDSVMTCDASNRRFRTVIIPPPTRLISEEQIDAVNDFISLAYKKTTGVLCAIYNNLEINAGVGQGLYLDLAISGIAVGMGAYCNYACWQLSGGEWSFGQDLYAGCTTSLIYDFGAAHHEFKEMNGEWHQTERWFLYNPEQTSVSLVGYGCYLLFLGASFDIGINPIGFCEDLDAIIRG